MLFFAWIARFAVGHDDALLSEGLHHGCQERDPPDGDSQATSGSTFFSVNPKLAEDLSNAGTVKWSGTSVADANDLILDSLGTPVINTGTFTLDGGTKGDAGQYGGELFIMNRDIASNQVSFYQTSGSLNFQNGATLGVQYGYYQSAGSLQSDSTSGNNLRSGVSADGDIDVAGGNVIVDTVANTVSTLTFSASTVELNGELQVSGLTQGGLSKQSDQLNCGSATVTFGTNSTLTVGTTGNGGLGINNSWTVLTFGPNNGGKDWAVVNVPPGSGMTEKTSNNNSGTNNTVVSN